MTYMGGLSGLAVAYPLGAVSLWLNAKPTPTGLSGAALSGQDQTMGKKLRML